MDGVTGIYKGISQNIKRIDYGIVQKETAPPPASNQQEDSFKAAHEDKMAKLQENRKILASGKFDLETMKASEAYFALSFSLITGPVGATLNSVRKTYVDSLIYELGTFPGGSEIRNKVQNEGLPEKNPFTDDTQNISNDKIAEQVGEEAAAISGGEHSYIISDAVNNTKQYFKMGDSLIIDGMTIPISNPDVPADTQITKGYGKEVEAVNLSELKWNKVDEYATTRVGPLTELLKTLGKDDELRFSNLTFDQAIKDIDRKDIELAGKLNLPISSWSKEVNVVLHKDGKRTVVLSDFAGKSLMSHFELLSKKVMEDQPEQPKVKVIESKTTFNERYSALSDLFESKREELKGVDTVVVGYNQAFAENWKDKYVKSVSDSSLDWSANIYEMPDEKKTRVAVLESHASFHGEILGENLRQMVDKNPQIKNVFTAGSGGSLHIRNTYELVFPAVVSGNDQSMNNVLSPGSDKQVHKSVISPLAETPSKLSEEINAGCTTMDMEMGYVAEALSGKGINLGVGILVTDFPVERPISKGVSLTFQDSSRKYSSMKKYTDAVYNFVNSGKPSFEHKIEEQIGKTVAQASKENLNWQMEDLGQMTENEKVFFDRFCKLEPDYSFRMSPSRLGRLIDDGAILSTQQVKDIKKAQVTPFTPEIENKMYGALDYTFGSVSFHDGDPQYGSIVIKIKPEVWENRSWATYRSGWRAVVGSGRDLNSKDFDYDNASPEIMDNAIKKFGTWIVTPEDYMQSMAAYAVKHLRSLDPKILELYLKSDDDQMRKMLGEHADKIGFLEAKIKGSMNLEDIKEVVVPADCPQELLDKLKAKGIPWKMEEKAV